MQPKCRAAATKSWFVFSTLALAVGFSSLAWAQEETIIQYDAPDGTVGNASFGFEAGLPLVVGLEFSYRIKPRWRFGASFGHLSDFSAIRAEARWLLREEARNRFVPSIVAGVEQFFLKDGPDEATPIGVHAAVGLDYYLRNSPISVGGRLGVLRTLGSSDGDDVKVFAIKNDFTSGMFNLGVRYHF